MTSFNNMGIQNHILSLLCEPCDGRSLSKMVNQLGCKINHYEFYKTMASLEDEGLVAASVRQVTIAGCTIQERIFTRTPKGTKAIEDFYKELAK